MPQWPGQPGMAVTDGAGRFVLKEFGMHAGIRPGKVVIFKANGPPTPVVEVIEASPVTAIGNCFFT